MYFKTTTHTHTLSCKGGWEMYSVAEYLLQAKAQGNSFTIRREFTIKGENG